VSAKGLFDFLARLVFFAVTPRLIVLAAALYPVSGAIVQIGLALLVFFVAEAARSLASRSKIAALLLSSQLQFEAYYREHPPRPFLYYVFYPLLFPYWLWAPHARREFLLFKGYTLASFGMLVLSLGVQYVRFFPPELSFADFAPIAAKTFLAETVVVLIFLMPIFTSVVHYQSQGSHKRLAAILIAGVVSSGLAIERIERARDPVVSLATRDRVRLRTRARPAVAAKAQAAALAAAWKAIPTEKGDVDSDGKVEDVPLGAARAALATYYKSDETFAFDLWREVKGKQRTLVLYFEARQKNPPIWLAMDTKGTFHDAKRLPRGAFPAMRAAADAIDELEQ
jgi:hypothetical protein